MAPFPTMASFSISPQFSPSFFPRTSQLSTRRRTQKPLQRFSCRSKDGDKKLEETTLKNGETFPAKLDRRNLLLSIGGLYGAASVAANNHVAFAAPPLPDFKHCNEVKPDDGSPTKINCCPPEASDISPYVPSYKSITRTRMPAQTIATDSSYYRKYKKAIEKMKNLKSTDPRNFTQQANVHCAYCDGAYNQLGINPKLLFEIHDSWLFFPWHRWYLYFFEKICANLIDDDTFALPFWNWDDPTGMKIPDIYVHDPEKSPLYDKYRNPNHLPPTIIDLDWSFGDPKVDEKHQIKRNLKLMYSQMITQSKSPTDFFGNPYRAGDANPGGRGKIEDIPHNHVHVWTGLGKGDPNYPRDMGAFYSAGRDPIFYAHHANIDRMWSLWLNPLGGTNLTDPDWLDVTSVFYNEEAKPVRVRMGDCVDTTKLGYTYENVPIAWLDQKPTARAKAKSLLSAPKPVQVFPATIDKAINVIVERPKKSETRSADEILVIEGIEYDKANYVKLKVYINEDDVNSSGPEYSEYLGSFSNVPHSHGMKGKANLRFRISEVLNDLGANDYESVVVTLVPKSGPIKINGVKIEFELSA